VPICFILYIEPRRAAWSEVQFPAGLRDFFFLQNSQAPPIQRVQGVLSPRLKIPGREADQMPPSNVADKRMSGETPLLPLYGVHTCNFISDFMFVFMSSPRCCLHLAERCNTASLHHSHRTGFQICGSRLGTAWPGPPVSETAA
jgi:hypothetical protein